MSRLVPSMRPIEEIDFGLWQTPVADDAMNRAKGKINSRGEPKLSGQVMSLWHTPTCHMAREGGLPGGVHEEHAHHDGGSLHGAWADSLWLAGADGKARRVKSGVRLLANGVPARVGKLRAYGNAIVPPLAAEVIKALM